MLLGYLLFVQLFGFSLFFSSVILPFCPFVVVIVFVLFLGFGPFFPCHTHTL